MIGHLTQRVPGLSPAIIAGVVGSHPSCLAYSTTYHPREEVVLAYFRKSPPVAVDGTQGLAHARQLCVPKLHPPPALFCSFVTGQLDILYFFNVASNITLLCVSLGF